MKTAWSGCLGKDSKADHLLRKFKRSKLKAYAKRLGQTQNCWIAVDKNGERQIYVFPNSTASLNAYAVEEKFKKVIKQSKHFHTEIAVIPLNAAIRGAEIAKRAKSWVFLDVDGDIDYLVKKVGIGSMYEVERLMGLADVVKLSESAARQLSRKKDLNDIITELLKSSIIVVVTLGNKGCIIASKKERHMCPAFNVECVDSTGAGDAFMGGLSYAILKKLPLKEVGMFANACGAYCCTRRGARGSGNLDKVMKVRFR